MRKITQVQLFSGKAQGAQSVDMEVNRYLNFLADCADNIRIQVSGNGDNALVAVIYDYMDEDDEDNEDDYVH